MGTKQSEEIGFVPCVQFEGQSDPQEWVFSTGSTVNVCHSRDKFDNYRPVTGKHVSLMIGGEVNVAGIGSVTLSFTSGKKVTLPAVLHCPSFITNVVSVGKFSEQGLAVTFEADKTMIYKDNKFFGNGCVRGGVFVLNVENDNHSGSEGPST